MMREFPRIVGEYDRDLRGEDFEFWAGETEKHVVLEESGLVLTLVAGQGSSPSASRPGKKKVGLSEVPTGEFYALQDDVALGLLHPGDA